jgi:hypothetical protein
MSYKRGAKAADKGLGKAWRVLGESTDGKVVTLGKYETKESAEADKTRIEEEGFYHKLKITYTPIEVKPEELVEPAVAEVVEERRPRGRRPAVPVEEEEEIKLPEPDDEADVPEVEEDADVDDAEV